MLCSIFLSKELASKQTPHFLFVRYQALLWCLPTQRLPTSILCITIRNFYNLLTVHFVIEIHRSQSKRNKKTEKHESSFLIYFLIIIVAILHFSHTVTMCSLSFVMFISDSSVYSLILAIVKEEMCAIEVVSVIAYQIIDDKY